jgi:hypothetical protein
MTRDRDDAGALDRLRSRRWAIYAVWLAILVVSFAAGGATFGLLVDYESVGTDDDPNRIQVVGNWAGFAPANDTPAAEVNGTDTDETDETGMGNVSETDTDETDETGMGNVNETADVPSSSMEVGT